MLRVQKLLFVSALMMRVAAVAQEKETVAEPIVTELDPVTVSSSLSSLLSSKTGRNIVVIKGEQFAKLPVNSIDDLLRYVPGIEIQARGPMGSQSDIVLRGATFQQVLVIIDGVRVNDPLTGHFSSYIPIAPSEIERIEVLKGASSAIYGSDAVGGVINIITKTFANTRQRKEVTAQLAAGEYGLFNANAGGLYSNGKTSVGLGILSNNADGQPQRGTRGFFNMHTASLSLNHRLNERWQVGFRSALDDRDFSAQNYYTTFASDTATERVKSFWNQLHLNYAKAADKLTISAGYKTTDDHYAFNKASIANDNKSKLFQALAIHEHKFSDFTTLISGAQFVNRGIRSNDRGNHDVKQAAAFAILQQMIGTKFMMSPALRIDWDERGGTELVPQVNLSYRTGDFNFRGSAGKTIRHADFTERYNNYNKALVTSGRIGNPDLGAERSFSFEAGADFFASQHLKISATYFQRDHDNLIDYVTTPYAAMPRKTNLTPTGTYALAKNIATVTTKGAETDVYYNHDLGNSRQFLAMLGLAVFDSESSEMEPSFYVSSHANFLSNFSLQFAAPGFSFGINGLYKTRQEQAAPAIKAAVSKDYFLLNVKGEGFIIPKKLSLFVQVDNIFDRSYSDLLGTPMPGRWFMGGLKLSLIK